jgi:hypothetical protein
MLLYQLYDPELQLSRKECFIFAEKIKTNQSALSDEIFFRESVTRVTYKCIILTCICLRSSLFRVILEISRTACNIAYRV